MRPSRGARGSRWDSFGDSGLWPVPTRRDPRYRALRTDQKINRDTRLCPLRRLQRISSPGTKVGEKKCLGMPLISPEEAYSARIEHVFAQARARHTSLGLTQTKNLPSRSKGRKFRSCLRMRHTGCSRCFAASAPMHSVYGHRGLSRPLTQQMTRQCSVHWLLT